MHLPRSVFSRKQLDLFLWLLRVNHVESVPSTKNMTSLNKILQGVCGIETIAYEGRLGHPYHVNNLSQILAQVSRLSYTVLSLILPPENAGKHVASRRATRSQSTNQKFSTAFRTDIKLGRTVEVRPFRLPFESNLPQIFPFQ